VKFLVDHQLPPALVKFIQGQGHTAQHVRDLGLKTADDAVIWRHAAANDVVVITKDEDFYFLGTSPGNTVKLLWVRIGNCRTKALLETFETQLPRVVAAFDSGAVVVEIR
jgi:predicted nuclease of predicted toxin-antitoxin system